MAFCQHGGCMKSLVERFQCLSCGHSGLYIGQIEGQGEGVVCFTCDGRGWVTKKSALNVFGPNGLLPFVRRASRRSSVLKVFLAHPSRTCHSENSVTYDQFLRGKRPEEGGLSGGIIADGHGVAF